MSGIAGVFFLDGRSARPADVQQMGETILHRGRDASSVWCDGPLGFAHRMLWTTPESLKEKLPFVNKTGDLSITADARIDNRDEFFATLDFGGRPPAEIADSELILAAYERWGERCAEKLLGDFAFAIWDGRRQVLFCARDHMGVKPFYYHRGRNAFFFGSEIKALLSWPEVPRRLNEVRVADYLCSMLEDKEITFYEEILRLPPAHTLTVGREGTRLQRYWQLDPKRDIRMGSDQEYAEAFRSIFTEAVRCRLRSAFPVGSMLSGGLDSSWIVCVARKLLADSGHPPLHTFSATFETVPQCDERRFIEAVVTQGGVEPHFIAADRLGPLVDLDRILRFTDEAFFAPNLYMHWALFQAAAGAGVRVLLDGLEGDAVVSFGVKRLAELTRSGRWLEVARSASKIGHDFGGSRRAILWRHAIKPCLPPWTRQMWLGVRNPVRPIWDPERIVNPTFSRQVRVGDRWRALLPQDEPRTEQENHLRRLNSALIPLLHEAVDTPAAFVGIEPAYPFADRRLVEFCLAAPSSQKLKGGWTRWLIRRAMEGILPPAVQWREGKSDLSPNFNRGMRELHREIIEEQLRQPGTLGRFVDMGTYREVCRRYLSSGTTSQAMAVWKAVTLGKWLSLVNWENREKPGK